MISRSIAIALAIGLAASGVANMALGRAWLAERDAHLAAAGQLDQATGTARACSAGVEQLEKAARDRQRQSQPAIAAAAAAAGDHQVRAQQILSAPATVPGDACASAGDAIDAWLVGRVRK